MNHLLQNSIFQGVISGLISSSIFLLILYSLKPRIVLSDKISCHYVNWMGKDRRMYNFKVINKSPFFKLYDVKVTAYICRQLPNTNGNDIHRTVIKFLGSETRTLAKFNRKHYLQNILQGDKSLTTRTDYAAQFSTEENIKNAFQNDKFIICEVMAKHSLTGFAKVVQVIYLHSTKVVDGRFYTGNSCKIIETSPENKTIIP
ncbi:hypothetical protein HH214_10615 [Mucilaginibacter robiniae]|uniref:Uncharacterized protein n=1 Tax=Mucilaginibacter robiniae TaxID=2728022 RepID=A0A7L5DYU0_9SPHI|nr:hypothetical protein [Mucilaginibacter robiniae]QJD96282.1 hypothetical protein HH214_10615 [Mucilaginibacter robiniae]